MESFKRVVISLPILLIDFKLEEISANENNKEDLGFVRATWSSLIAQYLRYYFHAFRSFIKHRFSMLRSLLPVL